jgi:hypothetical protein
VPADEAQGLNNGHHGDERNDIEADKNVLRTSTEGLDDVDELHGVLHVAWRVPHVFTELLGQILGQVVGWSADGADDGPEGGTFLVYLRKPVQSRMPRTLWQQLLCDLLGKR